MPAVKPATDSTIEGDRVLAAAFACSLLMGTGGKVRGIVGEGEAGR